MNLKSLYDKYGTFTPEEEVEYAYTEKKQAERAEAARLANVRDAEGYGG